MKKTSVHLAIGMNNMKLIWCSDIHLNFLNETSRQEFYKNIVQSYTKGEVCAVIISGDIAESHNVALLLKEMCEATKLPVFFVFGNHDFYGSNIAAVKRSVKGFSYIGNKTFMPLTSSAALVGVDGWGDCRYGDYENSRLTMSDWIYIEDLRGPYGLRHYEEGDSLKDKLQQLADKDARALARKTKAALKNGYKRIIIVTHVPPFEEAALYAGLKSTPSGLPFFASKILGEKILPIAKKRPNIDFLWLCGHTHSRAEYKPCDNMTVRVAKSEYYFPQIESVLEI